MKPLIWKKAFFILMAAIGILWLASHWNAGSKTPPVIIINTPYPVRAGEPGAPFTPAEAPLGFTEAKPVSLSTPYSYMGAPGYGAGRYTLKDMIPLYRKRQLSMSPYFEPYAIPAR